MITDLESIADWTTARSASKQQPIFVYKHSATCPTSAWAQRNVLNSECNGVPVYRVTVQKARDVSNQIATDLNVRHETPQIIVVYDGAAVGHCNHGRVTPEEIETLTQDLHSPS